MKKILIISYFFPPYNSIASKRYGTMCKYMKKYGFEPYILTTYSKGDLKIPVTEKNIKRIGKNSFGSIISHNKIKLTLFQWILFEFFEITKIQLRSIDKVSCSWFNEVKNEVLNAYKDIKLDLIIGTYGPIGNIMVAKFLSRKLGIPWIAEIRDLISQYNEDIQKGYKKSKFLDLMLERYLLNSSCAMIVVTKGFKNILKKYYNKKITVVYNGWEQPNKSKISINLKQHEYDYLYYAGSLYKHRMPSMFLLIEALKKVNTIKSMKLIIRSLGPLEFDRQILNYLNRINMLEKVILKSPCSDYIMIEEQKNSKINIVLSDISSKSYLLSTIPGKLMELINIDVPILAVTSPNSEIASVLDFTDKGVASDKKSDIVRYILNEHLNYKGNPKNIYRYSRKYQTKKLCNFLNKVLQ